MSMSTRVLPGRASSLCLCIVLAAQAVAAAEVTEADFDVPEDGVDAAVERLAALDFAEIARPAAAVLARREPFFAPGSRDPRLTDAEHEAKRRQAEDTAYTVARLVWAKRTEDRDDAAAVARVLAEIATGRLRADVDVRRVAILALGRGTPGPGTLTDDYLTPLHRVALHKEGDPTLRCLAADVLMRRALPAADEPPEWHESLLRSVPEIVRAQPTLAKRHAAFIYLTGIGKRLHRLPHDEFVELVRVGFALIEETPADAAIHASGTARSLGYMLKRPGEFSPPRDDHQDANGNLAPSYWAATVENARRWWDETGRGAMDAIAPVEGEAAARR